MEISSPLVQLALLESLKANEISDEIDLFLQYNDKKAIKAMVKEYGWDDKRIKADL